MFKTIDAFQYLQYFPLLSIIIACLIRPWIIWKLWGWLRVWTTSICVAPGSASLISSFTGTVNISVLVSEGQIVVTLTLNVVVVVWAGWVVILRIIILGIIILWVVIVSTVAATIIVATSSQKILKTKEPYTWLCLSWSLSLPPSTITSTTSAKVKEFSVGAIIRLSFSSSAWIISLVTTTIQSSTKDGTTEKSSTNAKETTINQLTASA